MHPWPSMRVSARSSPISFWIKKGIVMQFKLYFTLPRPLTLPIAYQKTLQGFLYRMLSFSPGYSAFLHDYGYTDEQYAFKLFVFGQIEGQHKVHLPYITFYDQIAFEVRSPMDAFCQVFWQGVMHAPSYELNHQEMDLLGCVSCRRQIGTDHVKLRMLSPLTVSTTYYTDEGKKKTYYYAPSDEDFKEALVSNYKRRWQSAFIDMAPPEIAVKPLHVTAQDKFVTRFGGKIYITGWNGIYLLEGDPLALTFLYDAGLGARGSQGFGLFERTED